MLKSFLQIAVRNFTKRKGYSILNLLGLTIGITCCLLIFEYVAHERSYDNFHEHADRIFRVQESDYQNGRFEVQWATTSPAVGPALKKDFPEVESFCRLYQLELLISNDAANAKFWESKSYIADPAVLTILHLPLVKGNPATALQGVNKIVISEDMARKYFGSEDVVGKVLTARNGGKPRPLEVTGVFENYPPNSHLVLDMLISYPTLHQTFGAGDATHDPTETTWTWNDFYTYVLLKKDADPAAFEKKLRPFIDRHYNSLPGNKANNDFNTLQPFAITDIHLYSHYGEEAEANGDGSSVSFLFLIAFFIAAIAWINYINLATARSLERAREVGVRKVLGALRTDLIGQFLVESLLLNGLALVLALIIAWVASPLFNQFTGRSISTAFLLPATYWEIFGALFLTGTFLSGIYPAFVLSRYHPVAVLKGLFKNTSGGQFLRKGLIVGQFAASILLIAGTIIVYNQVHYMRSRTLGVNIDQTVVLNGTNSMKDSTFNTIFPAFKQAVLKIKDVKGIAGSTNVMGQEITWSTVWRRLGTASKTNYTLLHLGIDYDFIGNYGLRLIAGRGFSRDFPSDKRAVLLNESAIRELGYAKPADAVGGLLYGDQSGIDTVHVIGVVADYHHQGLQKAIQPLAILLRTSNPGYFSIKINAGNTPQTVAALKKAWDTYFPADPFHYFFLDEFFDHQYAENERFGAVFGLFAGLAIFIACLGLLGLSAYNVIQRTKEIGIRKVLGAPTNHLLFILSRDFLLLVGFAFLIAVPITWWAMDKWLQEFAYRIHIGWWIFAIAGVLAFSIALLTVGLQALKATLANPVKSLRTE
jgi:putative ABC transport system permease protein